jgi:hypothetical protein
MPRPTTTTYKRYRKYRGGKTKYGKKEDYKSKKKINTKRRTEKRYRKRVDDEPMYKYYY